jgi:signal transduction histidine kinase
MSSLSEHATLQAHTAGGVLSEEERLGRRVRAAQVDLVYDLTPRALAALLAVSTLFAIFFFSPDRPLATPLWWALLTTVSAARYRLVRRFRDTKPGPEAARDWARRAVLGTLATGALWGYCIVDLGPRWGSDGYPLAVFLVAGIPAVGLTANAALLPGYLALQLPILLPYAATLLFLHGGELFPFLGGIAALIYALVLAILGRVVNRRIAEGFELRFRNQGLVERLARTNEGLRSEIERREQAERVLVEAKNAAETADRAKSRFLGKMSHEIRTPMNGILGMNELLLHSRLSPDQRRYAENVAEATRSLLQLVSDVLDVSRAEARGLALEPEDFDVRDVVAGAVEMLRERALDVGLALTLTVDERVPARVRGDSRRLRQVLVNLVGNAVKFTPKGRVTVSVTPADGPDGNAHHLRVDVRDTGIGIAQAAQGRLFQPFVQLDDGATRLFGGAGLGLAISRQLVQLMGGRIGVESAPGAGSLFWFSVCFEPAQEAVADQPRAHSNSGTPATPTRA